MPSPYKILAIDDENIILNLIKNVLDETYSVLVANNGKDGLEMAAKEKPALVLVDRIMPVMDGLATTRFLRNTLTTKDIPIIMLTALKEPTDRMAAFAAGVDDFISKPFHPDELVARIDAKIRRFVDINTAVPSGKVTFLNMSVNFEDCQVTVGGKLVHLTRIEYSILKSLLSNLGGVQSRSALLAEVWGKPDTDLRALDAHLTSLRKKITNFDGVIATVYGRGDGPSVTLGPYSGIPKDTYQILPISKNVRKPYVACAA